MSLDKLKFIPPLIGLLVYLGTINHGLVLDDGLIITNNQFVQQGISGISDLLTHNYANGGMGFNDGLYRPLSTVTFALEKSITGLSLPFSHFLNALLYALACWLVWVAMGRLVKNPMLALSTAILFAVHPIHTEVVSNLKSRDEILALTFFLWSIIHFDNWLKSKEIKHLLAACALFFIALFSKESAFTFLAIYPLWAWFQLGDIKKVVVSFIALLLPGLGFLLIRFAVLNNMGPTDSGVTGLLQNPLTVEGEIIERLATTAKIQWLYFEKLFIPIDLAHDYSYNAISVTGFTDSQSVLGSLSVAGLIGLGMIGLIKRKLFGFGILFYFITISAVSNVFILIGAMAAERFVFAPSLGWSIAFSWLLFDFIKTSKSRWVLISVIGLLFSLLTVSRSLDWKSNYTLYAADIEKVENSARAHYNLGTALNDQVRIEPAKASKYRNEAIKHLNRAIEIYPEYQDAYNNLGIVYLQSGNYAESIKVLESFLAKFPDYSKGYYNLAVSAFNNGTYDKAEKAAIQYLEQTGIESPEMLFIAGESAGYQNKLGEAISWLTRLIAVEPQKSRGAFKLGMAYAMTGNPSQGKVYLEKASQIEPNNADIWLNLAMVYGNLREPNKALQAINQSLVFDPSNERALQFKRQLTGQ